MSNPVTVSEGEASHVPHRPGGAQIAADPSTAPVKPSAVPNTMSPENVPPRAGRALCPYLEVGGGRWRHPVPSRDHRCLAVLPPPPLTTDKQRRLCLGPAYVTCASYRAAQEARGRWMAPRLAEGEAAAESEPAQRDHAATLSLARLAPPAASNRWAIPRSAPVVVVPRSGLDLSRLLRHRAAVQSGLLTLLIVAFAAIAISRMPSGQSSSGALLVPSASPTATPSALAPTPPPTAVPLATPLASPLATLAVVVEPTAAPTLTLPPTPATYRVVSGDTLSGLAARWGTTVRAIMDLNSLSSSNLRVGQQLQIPSGGAPAASGSVASPG